MNPAPQLYNEVLKIAAAPDSEPRAQVQALSVLMERLLMEATKAEQIAFSTLFARICYVGHRHSFQSATLQVLHAFRRVAARTRQGHSATAREVRLGVKALSETILVLYQTALPPELLPLLPPDGEWDFQPPDIWDFKALARVVALRDEPDHHRLVVVDEDDPAREVYVLYNLPDRNDNFRPTIELIRKVFGCPLTLHLLEVEIDRDGCYRPRGFVLEPDYLLDVSAVAECFKDTGPEPLSYLVRKFLPRETTVPLHLGNVANFFLDRLLNEPEASFPDLFRETFRNSPFVYAPMTDAEVREISQQAQKHYVTLRAMTAGGGLAKEGIDPEHSVLEPSFFSQQYGLQGRLDLFYRTEERAAIVELKSGKPFKPNRHGIARSHFTQTLLYDLLVRSVYGKQTDPTKYILYSAEPERPLRFAPTVEAEQWEALQVRNQLVGIERLLCDIRPGQLDVPILNRIRASGVAGKGFLERDFGVFEQRYRSFSVVQKKYFNAFAGFVAREQWLAKVGVHDVDNDYGHAALWRNHFAEKQAAFSILSHLAIADNQADQPDPFILFQKTEGTHPLANFRVGDIGVLYPLDNEGDTILHHQIIKCTITHLSTTEVRVQLRSRQFNLQPFATEALWCLEPDLMEASFGMMQQAVFENPLNPTPNPSPLRRKGDRLVREEDPTSSSGGKESTLPDPQSVPLPQEGGVRDEVTRFGKTASYRLPHETAHPKKWEFLKAFARSMRHQPTKAEDELWQALRNRQAHGYKFRRQHSIEDFIVDFVCFEAMLVVEVDGEIHDQQAHARYDQERTEYLNYWGFEVIRFRNEEILENLQVVVGEIVAAATRLNPTPNPSPPGEGDRLVREDNSAFLSERKEPTFPQPESVPLPRGGGVRGGVPLYEGSQTSEEPTLPQPQSVPLPWGGGVRGGVTQEQAHLLDRITQSQRYFLLWGPPGTGKTSVMLRELAGWVLNDTSDNLLLLAYTNRAVDEICEALDRLGGDIREQYLRIGSRFSTAPVYREQLLNEKIATSVTRAELRAVLDRHRIFVSTVASFSQNENLLKIKTFQRLVVDEASQILEPQIVGLLRHFEHWTLIGDHRQLPAVTAQAPEWTRVDDPDLNEIGLRDLRESYFERLYRHCEHTGERTHLGCLSAQGRMCEPLMEFPNEHFYGGLLELLDPEQQSNIAPGDVRVRFVATPPADPTANLKTNRQEAERVAELVLEFKQLWQQQGRLWHPAKTLGIITPWRAQIAQIRASLHDAGLDPDEVTIDTVERYQGGARDVILISTCVSSAYQLRSLVSLSDEGVDRKLNVALTRARQHLVLLGNPDLLRLDDRYRAFIERYA